MSMHYLQLSMLVGVKSKKPLTVELSHVDAEYLVGVQMLAMLGGMAQNQYQWGKYIHYLSFLHASYF
ncbi:unnamed protein product [Schistosoma rodhaini]|nr:unnamed protein product [Schistosoma rodhaini]